VRTAARFGGIGSVTTDLLGSISPEDFSWIDPVVGGRAFYNVTDWLSLLA
jgi:hypothetical protein